MKWYAVYTKPKKEDWAELNLNNMGVETFLPKYRARDRRKRERVRPLFPRYLFVRLDLDEPGWTSVRYARGVTSLVGFSEDGTPSPVPAQVIESIVERQDGDGVVRLVDDGKPKFKEGEAIRIIDGAFENMEAIFSAQLKDGDRVIVLLKLMERWVQVNLGKEQIAKK